MSSARRARVYQKLQAASHCVQKTADRLVQEAGPLTTSQAAALSVVAGFASCNQRMIASQLGLNESAVTAMVTRLIRDGFLTRERSETDARTWLLTLTDSGREALQSVNGPFAQINDRLEAVLTETEINQLADMLKRVAETFGEPDQS